MEWAFETQEHIIIHCILKNNGKHWLGNLVSPLQWFDISGSWSGTYYRKSTGLLYRQGTVRRVRHNKSW